MVCRVGGYWIILIGCLLWLPGATARQLQIEVAAPDDRHIGYLSARYLAGLNALSRVALSAASSDPQSDTQDPPLYVLSLHDLAREVPELGVAQLPFFYSDLGSVHRALDGALGERLKAAARARGWTVLAFWDEGMQVMSGNLAYTERRALQGREFLLLRDDPIAEIELRALDVWSRRETPDSLGALHKECLVASRSATVQQIEREQLERVHLDLTLSYHRYEGWVVAMRHPAWESLAEEQRSALAERLDGMLAWQRQQAAEAEASALRRLVKAAMTAHPLAAATWRSYRDMQPAWEDFLSESLTLESRRDLVALAAAAAGVDLGGGGGDAPANTLPDAYERQQDHRDGGGER